MKRDEWKELAEYQTNRFRIGDKIRCYTVAVSRGFIDGVVTKSEEVTVTFESEQGVFLMHFKNCRKLINNELKKFWIKKGDAYSYGRGILILEPEDPENWFTVTEDA